MASSVDSDWQDIPAPQGSEGDWQDIPAPTQQPSFLQKAVDGAKTGLGIYENSQFGSPQDLLSHADTGIRSGMNRLGGIAQSDIEKNGGNPTLAKGVGKFIGAAPDIATFAGPEEEANLGQEAINGLYKKVVPPILKATKGIPPTVSRMTIDNPAIFDLPGTSASIQEKSQGIINGIKEASEKVGKDFSGAYDKAGIPSPLEEIKNGHTEYAPLFQNRSYQGSGSNVPGQTREMETYLLKSHEPVGGPIKRPPVKVTVHDPSSVTPGGPVSFQDVADTKPVPFEKPSFGDLRGQYQDAMRGDLFKSRDVAGGLSEMPDQEKLSTLTSLKRGLQDQAHYPAPGQQLAPSQGAHNAAIKQMAAEIDRVRGGIPGGDSLALADDAYSEMQEIKHRLMTAFRDPYTGQDYLNRIIKGNTDWLTSGRNAGKMGAIERVEQITGKKILQPALEEVAASYLKNPDAMGLPSTGLKGAAMSMIPTKAFLTPPNMTREVPTGPGIVSGVRGLFSGGRPTPQPLFQANGNGVGKGKQVQSANEYPRTQPNNQGNRQTDQNDQPSDIQGISNHGRVLDESTARKFLAKAKAMSGGLMSKAKELAREMATAAGYIVQ